MINKFWQSYLVKLQREWGSDWNKKTPLKDLNISLLWAAKWTSFKKDCSSSVVWLNSCDVRHSSHATVCHSVLKTSKSTVKIILKRIIWFVASASPVKTHSKKKEAAIFYSDIAPPNTSTFLLLYQPLTEMKKVLLIGAGLWLCQIIHINLWLHYVHLYVIIVHLFRTLPFWNKLESLFFILHFSSFDLI